MTDFGSRQESSSNGGEDTRPTTTATTASWTRLKDPRIVRVSRALGGKDRHSKVYTVRGLRDRRVRLSVPTAIQLYDLQERLGLNQPSKVVDWLLHAAKHDIDELPPLQIPPDLMLNSHHLPSDHSKLQFKDGAGERKDHQSWTREDEEARHGEFDPENPSFMHKQQNHLSFSRLMSSSNSIGRWDPSSLTLIPSHTTPISIPISLGMTGHHHHQDLHSLSVVYQSGTGMIAQPYFTPQIAPTNAGFDHHATARPLSFNMAADHHLSQSTNGPSQQSKRHDLHSS